MRLALRWVLPGLACVAGLFPDGNSARASNFCPDTIVLPTGVGIGTASDVTTLNLLLSNSLYSTEAAELLYPLPLYLDDEAHIDYSRSVYAAIDASADGTLYRVTLHPRRWSDGVPLTADDFLYTYQLMMALGPVYTNYGVGGIPNLIKKFTVIDKEHFQIELTQKANPTWFILGGLSSFWPFPRHVWGKYATDDVFSLQSNPNFFRATYGPYKLEALQIGRYASFVPNPEYPLEKPHTKRLVLKFVESDGEALQGVQSGEIDLANLPFSVFDIGKRIKNTYLVPATPPMIDNNIGINFKDPNSPYFHDVRVRQAMEDAIDQKAIIRAALHGQGMENYNPVPPRPLIYNSPAARAGRFPVGYNPSKATQLLEEAGYTPGPDGIRQKNGIRLAITMLVASNQEYRIAIAEMVQRQLLAVGIKLSIKLVDFNQLLATISQNVAPWQAYLIGDTFSDYPTGELLYKTNGVENFGRYSDAKMDQLIEDSITKPGIQGLYEYEDYGAEQQPVIYLPVEIDTILVRNGIGNVKALNTPDTGWYPQYLTVCGKGE